MQKKNCAAFKRTLEELKEMLTITEQYKLLSNFRARCLDPAMAEISANTDIDISYDFEKVGKKVIAIIFTAKYKEGKRTTQPRKSTRQTKK